MMRLKGNDLLVRNGPGAPASISVVLGSPQSANCGAAYAAPLVVVVRDAGGTPVPNVNVTFTAPASGASGTFASSGTNTETRVTGPTGQATSSMFTANYPDSGAYNVVASVGALSCNFAMTNLIVYLIRDDFTTAEAAPIASPRTDEPGPGQWNKIDTANKLSISTDRLRWSSMNAVFDPSLLGTAFLPRRGGRAICGIINSAVAGSPIHQIGWSSTLTATAAALNPGRRGAITYDAGVLTIAYYTGSGIVGVNVPPALSGATDYPLVMVQRSSGNFYFAYVSGAWRLVWVSSFDSTASLAPFFSVIASAVGSLDKVFVRDLPAPFDTDYGIAVQHIAAPLSGTAYSGVADGIFDLTVTAPTPLANTAELRFRQQDATNYWTAYFAANGSFNVDSVVTGTPTNRITVAGVIAQGNTRTMRVITNGTLLDAYTLSDTTWTKRGSQVNQNLFTTQTTVVPVMGTGWTCANLDVWARTNAAWDTELNKS